MKNVLLFPVFFFLGVQLAFAQYPIPSYNTTVDNRATFSEQYDSSVLTENIYNTDKKRNLNVNYHPAKTLTSDVIVYAYSLDHQTLLGPYDLFPYETLPIEIDEREWGILVYTEIEIILNVWIE